MDRVGEILIYQTEEGETKIETIFYEDTIWLTQDQLSELFQKAKSTINEHLKNIFEEGELIESDVMTKFGFSEYNRQRPTQHYNLDAILAVGYRVKSQRGIQFRKWASGILKEYMQKGFAMDDNRLKGYAGGNYWKELLDRIRDIRSSEKVLYRQVLELYSTSIDYNPQSAESIKFFKIVQNKLHYAVHGNTAAEVIYNRADSSQPFMGLRTFLGDLPALKDISIAKNYLDKDELKILNNLVSGYFDLAEINAIEHKPMYMYDYIKQLDIVLLSSNRKVLVYSGSISHKKALEKAKEEYLKYQENQISPVEKAYLDSIKIIEANTKK